MSNLLKDASILLTPTAYENGRMNAIKPYKDLYGPELVTNGDFSNGLTSWTAYGVTSVSSGIVTIGASSNSGIFQGILTQGKKYKATINVTSYNGVGNAQVTNDNGSVLYTITTTGLQTFYFEHSISNANVIVRAIASGVLSISSFSVVEDLSGDFTFSRNSAATRVDAQGLVENVQILSPELVSNGNFSQIGAEEVSNGNFSQEGSELITNGDFATDSNWNGTNTNGVTISNGSLNYSETTLNHNVSQSNVVTIGKSYKVTLTISNYVKGSVLIIVGAGGSIQEVSSNGTFTMYGVASINNTFYLQARGVNGTSLSIDNISVKEVGQDWSLGTGWSIGDGVASKESGVSTYLLQSMVLPTPNTYKVTFTVSDYTSGDVKWGFTSTTASIFGTPRTANGTYTEYFTHDSNTIALRFRASSTFEGSITNISVKEVGQDWTFGSGWSLDQANSKATCDGTQTSTSTLQTAQGISNIQNDLVKLSFEIKDYSAGAVTVTLQGTGGVEFSNLAANGVYEINATSTDSSPRLLFNANSSFVGSITNISVKEITDDTDLPRINYEGFSYQDSLGSEEIVNGDFSNGSANWGNYTSGSSTIVFTDVATLNVDASNSNVGIYQENVFASGKQYKVVLRIKASSSFDAEVLETQGAVTVSTIGSVSLTTSYQDFTFYFTGTGTNDIFIHRKYSSSSANQSITIDNVSVKEYLGQEVVPDSGCGSWLLEPQSTNMVTYSEDFSQWINNANTTFEGGYLAPDGTLGATKVSGTIGTSSAYIGNGSTSTQTRTIWARTVSGTGTAKLTSYYQNTNNLFTLTEQWQRFEVNGTTSGVGGTNFYVDFRDNSQTLNEFIVWGAQSENLPYATSYIPTNGATSTRLQDIANNSGNSTLINSTEGVLYAEATYENLGVPSIISLTDGTNTNRVMIYWNTNDTIILFVRVNGVYVAEYTIPANQVDVSIFNKIALKYKTNDMSFWLNGTKVATDTSGTMFSANTLTKLAFNSGSGGAFYGKNKALAVYKEALADANLRCLTYPNPVATTFDLDFDTIAEQFTFTRGSEATFVNAQGLIESTNELGAELVTNGDFATDSDWNKGSGWSISGGKANANTVGSFVNLRTNSSVVEPSRIYDVSFDVSNYTQGSVRLSFIQSVATSQVSANGTYTARLVASSAGSSQVYIQGINSFIGSIDNVSVKEVTTATNTPRIDYSTGEKAFLLEPQSTNLITYSEDFSQWNNTDVTIGANGTSPSGEANANLIQTGTANSDQVNESFTIPATNTATYSVFIKRVSGAEWVDFLVVKSGFSNSLKVWFNINNGTVGSNNPNGTTTLDSALVEDFGNGWYRLKVTTTDTTNNTAFNIRVRTASADGSDTRVDNSSYYLWGAQLEQQSYATSYIPTNGAAATRNQELCNNATPVINSEEGTLYAEISALEDDLTFRGLSISDGTTSNACRIYYRNSSNRVQFLFNVGGASQFQQLIDLTNIKDYNKIAFSYKKNNFKVYINGVKVAEDTNGIVPSANTFNKLSFSRADGGESFFGNTKGLKVYPKALADVQLEDLTTI